MSEIHLTVGSEEPRRIPGLLRIYSMKFCPYAQRSRLVAKAKGIPHDIVNINLFRKPEWYFQIHPEGKVPALLDGDKVIVESLDICDYLDEKYPENPLYPAEPQAKSNDKKLIKKIGPVTEVFAKLCFTNESKTPEEWVKEFVSVLQVFEDELASRGNTFFGGDKPGMVDYMLWPWAERAGCVPLKLGMKLPFADDHLPLIRKWRKEMQNTTVCSEIYNPPEAFWKIAEAKLKGEEPKYDE